MKRADLVKQVRRTLAQGGFMVSAWGDLRPIGFDLVARRDDRLLIIKVLKNVDSFNERVADELKVLARFLDGVPILVGDRSSSHRLDPGVVYARQGIPVLAHETLRDHVLEGVPPFVYSAPGGYYVQIDGDLLKRIRQQRNISLGQLADAAHSSRRTISMYEEGMSAMVDAALRLEEFLGVELIEPIDLREFAEQEVGKERSFEDFEAFEKEIVRTLLGIDLDVVPTSRAPFRALTVSEELTILTGMARLDKKLIDRARLLADLSRITERGGVFFVTSTKREILEGTPLVSRDELGDVGHREELLEMIRERGKAAKQSS